MESVHGVDVSWLHRPQLGKGVDSRARSTSSPLLTVAHPNTAPSIDDAATSLPPHVPRSGTKITVATNVASLPELEKPTGNASPANESPAGKTSKRPSLLSRNSADRLGASDVKSAKKGSWMSSISSKFSTPAPTNPITPESPTPSNLDTSPRLSKEHKLPSPSPRSEPQEHLPYVPQKPKEPGASFFSSISRRLSSNSPSSSSGGKRSPGPVKGICPRMVLNVDPNRQRCPVPALKDKSLRKVAFSVDVEIAAQPRYKDDSPVNGAADGVQNATPNGPAVKMAEAAEGAALKHPDAAAKDPTAITNQDPLYKFAADAKPAPDASDNPTNTPANRHKKEKKKKSEEERKERKEKKRQKAEDSGCVPVEFVQENDTPELHQPPRARASSNANKIRPTTDPVRIYRRCCQLRESPILKRITEQLMSPTCIVIGSPCTVAVLDLTGSRMQPPDMVTLADWLAVVPVKRLVLDDSDLNDEGLRVILAGLLASQTPIHSKSRNSSDPQTPRVAKLGIIEKLSLKNNPRITAMGWNHIALFLYMCRSIKAVDLSMVPFPKSTMPKDISSQIADAESDSSDPVEIFCKSLSERLAGSSLEEIILSECGLDAYSVRRLTDAMTICGIPRLGLAGVELDDQAFASVLAYIRSDVCNALDLGSNNLAGKVQRLAEALSHSKTSQLWGLSLASCNLETDGLDVLLSAVETLPLFKFIDLSHNQRLCQDDEKQKDGIQVLREHIPRLKHLKRLHLVDVGMNIQQAIALAEILPEGQSLAHVSLLENEALSTSISRMDENSQEEACALFASLMAAVKVSSSIVCIDIDVPPNGNCEVIKGMAKQVVAYCLRNMGNMAIGPGRETAVDALNVPYDKTDEKPADVPEVLLHLVGDSTANGDAETTETKSVPDENYIVGGTGLVKALQYCLSGKAKDALSGMSTDPRAEATLAPPSQDFAKKGKAKEMSKGLLENARQMRARLQPQLAKEVAGGDEMSYRRLQFLDSTLQGMISRFEDEYPETRLNTPTGGVVTPPTPDTAGSLPWSSAREPSDDGRRGLSPTTADGDDEDRSVAAMQLSRRPSDVSLASKVLSIEEGRLHRLSVNMKRDILAASPSRRPPTPPITEDDQSEAGLSPPVEDSYIADLRRRIEGLSGDELKDLVHRFGFEGALEHVGANVEDLRMLHETDPVAWEQFKESQCKATLNLNT